jgi:hypothetical protein
MADTYSLYITGGQKLLLDDLVVGMRYGLKDAATDLHAADNADHWEDTVGGTASDGGTGAALSNWASSHAVFTVDSSFIASLATTVRYACLQDSQGDYWIQAYFNPDVSLGAGDKLTITWEDTLS